jgi:hypothetical protein
MSFPVSPTHRRARRLVVAAALAVGLAAGAFATPASAEPTTVSSWSSHPHGYSGTVYSWSKTIVRDNQASSAGKSVRIQWRCGGQVVQDTSILLVANAYNAAAGGYAVYPSTWGFGPPSNCTLTEWWPNSIGQPQTPLTTIAPYLSFGQTVINHY